MKNSSKPVKLKDIDEPRDLPQWEPIRDTGGDPWWLLAELES
jgi:hypothetical protein